MAEVVVGRQVEGIGLEERKIGWVEAGCTRAFRMFEAEVPCKLVLDWEEHILVLAEAEEERKPGLVGLEGHTLVVEVERKPLVGRLIVWLRRRRVSRWRLGSRICKGWLTNVVVDQRLEFQTDLVVRPWRIKINLQLPWSRCCCRRLLLDRLQQLLDQQKLLSLLGLKLWRLLQLLQLLLLLLKLLKLFLQYFLSLLQDLFLIA